MAAETFSLRIGAETREQFDGILEAVKSGRGLSSKAEALAALIPAMEKEAAGEVAPALTSYVANIEGSLAAISANVRAMGAVYAEVEAKERSRAAEQISAQAKAMADMQSAAEAEQKENGAKISKLSAALDAEKARAEAAERALDEARARIGELEGEIARLGADRATFDAILAAINEKGHGEQEK